MKSHQEKINRDSLSKKSNKDNAKAVHLIELVASRGTGKTTPFSPLGYGESKTALPLPIGQGCTDNPLHPQPTHKELNDAAL